MKYILHYFNKKYNCRKYCALNNPITNLFIKSNGSVVIGFKKNKGTPDIVKLRLQLTLNEVISFGKTLLNLYKIINHQITFRFLMDQ